MDNIIETCNAINEYLNDIYINESLSAEVGETIRNIQGNKKLNKEFGKGIPGKHKVATKEFSDKHLESIKKLESDLRSVSTYIQYKPLFNKFCKEFGINASIIYKIRYDKDNVVSVLYEDLDKDMIVPNGSTLIHISPNSFGELIPQFRSKTVGGNVIRGGYLYSTPRVYVTLNKNNKVIGNTIADLGKNVKTIQYEIPENIKTIKIDPAIRNTLNSGAGYIETSMPIKVRKVSKDNKKDSALNAKKAIDNVKDQKKSVDNTEYQKRHK